MKKITFYFLILFFTNKANCQNISKIVVSQIFDGLNIVLTTSDLQNYMLHSNTHSVNDNVINVDLCYFMQDYLTQEPQTETRNIFIPLPSDINNYVLNIRKSNFGFWDAQQICVLKETVTLELNMPLVNSVSYLKNDSFSTISKTKIYPNPTNGLIKIDFGTYQENAKINLTNVLGQKIAYKKYQNIESTNFEIFEPNGIYFLEIENQNQEKKTIKIVKQ